MDSQIDNYKGYLGNINLKRSGVNIDWTPEMVQEYLKCAQDPIYFNKKYVKIINVDDGLVPFGMYGYQEDMMQSMHDNRYTIITTARQTGKSTTTVGFILWYVLFNSDKTVALLANKGETAREILGRVQLAYEHLPKWLQQGVVEWNKGSFELENNSRVLAAATSASAIRGYSINLLFIDEAAFIENWDEFFTSVFPTISSGKSTKIVLVSTPNGLNHFYKLWDGALTGENNYNPIKVMWNDVPGRDEAWMKDTLAAMGGDTEKFNQEHCCEFLGSSGTLIAGWKLKELVVGKPEHADLGLSLYNHPEQDRVYTIICDVSRGKGLDYSAFQVIDVTQMPYRQVCTYRNNLITPADFAEIAHRTAKSYNNATILVEINDIGQQVADTIYKEFEYEGVLFTEFAGRGGKRVTGGFGKGVDIGVRTTKAVKNTGCSLLKLLVEQNQLIVNDYHTIMELSTFSRKGISWEAESGNHDDLVMCLVLFAWLSDQQYFKELTNINTLMRLRDKTDDDIEADLLPFGLLDTGHDYFDDNPETVFSGDEFASFLRS